MEDKPESTINYLQFVNCTLDAVKEDGVTGQATTVTRVSVLGLPIDQYNDPQRRQIAQ